MEQLKAGLFEDGCFFLPAFSLSRYLCSFLTHSLLNQQFLVSHFLVCKNYKHITLFYIIGVEGTKVEGTKETIKALIDLTRAHFFLVWILLFYSGLALAFSNYGEFSWEITFKAVLIGLFGFEGGLVLNDYVDRKRDRLDVEESLTGYWRPFKSRPLPSGRLSPDFALAVFLLLSALTGILMLTLPYPNSLYVFFTMLSSCVIEYFYQVKRKNQSFPIAQLIGRMDFALFPVAGYLCYGRPDTSLFLYLLFFYPWTLAHLAVNDFIDTENDRARGIKSIPVLYGIQGTLFWISGFTLLHYLAALLFLKQLGSIAFYGFLLGFLVIGFANYKLLKEKSQKAGLSALLFYHVSLVLYSSSIILDSFF
ncbi:prenyltransferase [Methanosarcina sp.]|uniref:prenyltransferase n=1 Tax=Methanosarcina sp. TaxID=2213 RepID=UPI002AB93B3D|nr:prenyltransferase [Methanosarcina sp.]MDY9926516.1 prenyltransferase [Methanosarcina sp.]